MAGKQKFTAQQVADALKATKGMIFLAAERLDCHHNTILNYIERYKTVADTLVAQRGQVVDVAESGLYLGLVNREVWAILFALRTLGKDRGYTERSEHRHGGDESAPPIRLESDAAAAEVRAILDTLRAIEDARSRRGTGTEPAARADPPGLEAPGAAGGPPPEGG